MHRSFPSRLDAELDVAHPVESLLLVRTECEGEGWGWFGLGEDFVVLLSSVNQQEGRPSGQ
jgi:hypothetical protein